MKQWFLAIGICSSSLAGSAQVNLQTGSAQQTFPLINYNDNKSGLSLGVSLSYNSGNGFLPGETISNVGAGWSLESGGAIMRIQAGEPDDQMSYDGDGTIGNLTKFPNGYLYNPYATSGCNTGHTRFPLFESSRAFKNHSVILADTEQDKFVFSFNGRAGAFTIGRDFQVKTLGDSRLKITVQTANMRGQWIRTTITGFSILTEAGIKYTFSQKSINRICRYKLASRDALGNFKFSPGTPWDDAYMLNRYAGDPLALSEYPYVVNGWFLSEIENTNNGQKITFAYDDVYIDKIAGKTVSHTRDPGKNKTGRGLINMMINNPDYGITLANDENLLNKYGPKGISLTYIRSIVQTKRIRQINFPNNSYVTFNYSSRNRVDLLGEKALENISYYTESGFVRGYQLKYGYLYKNAIRDYYTYATSSDQRFSHLCLLSIQKVGTGADNAFEPPYQFSYYTGERRGSDDIVPPSNTLSLDHWGYYNGINSDLGITEDHDNLSGAGRSYFKTVLSRFKAPRSGYAKNGLLKSIRYPTGGTLTYEYTQKKSNYTVPLALFDREIGGVAVSKTTYYDDNDPSKNIVKDFNYILANGKSSHWGDERPAYYNYSTVDFVAGKKRKFKFPGTEYPEMAANVDPTKGTIVSALLKAAIQSVALYAINLIFGSVVANVAGLVLFVAGVIYFIVVSNADPEFHRFALTNQNIILQNPLPNYYSRVEVMENGPPGYNGKTVYEFTDYKDYPLLSKDFKWPWIPVQRAAAWLYGLPKKETIYDKNGMIVKESANSYTPYATPIATPFNMSCKCVTHKKNSLRGDHWASMWYTDFTKQGFDFMVPRFYFNYTGRADVNFKTESHRNSTGEYFASSTRFINDATTLLQKGTVVARDENSMIMSVTYHAADYNIPGPLQTLKSRNAIHVPVTSETWLIKTNTINGFVYPSYEMLDAKVTEYKEIIVNGIKVVKPWKIYELNTKQPLAMGVIGFHDKNTLIRNPAYFRMITEYIYDNNANLVQTNAKGNKESYVNDFRDNYITASAINASWTDIAYTSFEADNKGSWNYNPVFIKTNQSLTGAKSFFLGNDPDLQQTSTITRTGLNPAKKYMVTYWLYFNDGEHVRVNGNQVTSLYNAAGWYFYKQEVAGVSDITLTGYGQVDELRLYPEDALMTTTAYKEGVGKITECDANNRLLYYEYDALGRTKTVRDQQRNIIKTYEYNYKKIN